MQKKPLVFILILASFFSQAQSPYLVKDLVASGTSGSSAPEWLTAYKNKLVFSATTFAQGNELWESDGTESGTLLIKDLHIGNGAPVRNLTICNDTLFFTTNESELWKTDGTGAGTVLVKAIGGLFINESYFIDVNGVLYFTANDGITGTPITATAKPPLA
ncbi:MAG: hypothetical protein V4658_11170, partial [Bacteroidota bacterium]